MPSESSQTRRPSRTRNAGPLPVPTTGGSKPTPSPASSPAPTPTTPIENSFEHLRIVDEDVPSHVNDLGEGEDDDSDATLDYGGKPELPKKAKAGNSSPPGGDSGVDGDQDKQRLKAITSCKQVLKALESAKHFSKKDKKALEVVNRFANEHITKIVFSDMGVDDLKNLQLSEKEIFFNDALLSERADQRQLSDRFLKTEALVDKMVISNKEVRSVFSTFNCVLESMDNPGPHYHGMKEAMEPKLCPELSFGPVLHDGLEGKYQMSGVADMVTFMVEPLAHLHEGEVRSLEDLSRKSKVIQTTVGSLEIKSASQFLSDKHKGEAVAQAKNASVDLNNAYQKFIMTDGQNWKFCILHKGRYYLSGVLGRRSHEKRFVISALDAWIWEDPEDSMRDGLWTLEE
ncbi:hypothetical protein ONZ45_g14982 [Pleurotus djamor]|nr:hypothetical protein ONZ45_g14982 [Pleurotus djamor]